ncbi:MAG: carboxypeptidase regulatory-like domain-containing protein, partial [Planctomycetaceae bacterium]|nr:carboxypeptidase regulatory-like domain-containing protein [Planctomycetaceae bacterium]
MNHRYVVSTQVLSLMLLAGCSGGGDANRQPTFPVTGTVTLGGGPLAGAAVTFSPKDGQPVATARTDANGKYSLTTYDA